MKKLALTIAIVLGLGLTTFANPGDGGLFQRGTSDAEYTGSSSTSSGFRSSLFPGLPTHNESTNQPAPLGSGVAIMLGLGAAYLVGKKRREE